MTGGISAIKGFDYQATVILDILLDFFEQHGSTASVRPEGLDDLDLFWTTGSEAHRRHVQIKKPREDNLGNPRAAPWTLSEAISELFPNTISHLAGNNAEQLWVLGDAVVPELASLITDGANAPLTSTEQYGRLVHALAQQKFIDDVKPDQQLRQKLLRWRVTDHLLGDPAAALVKMTSAFRSFARSLGLREDSVESYRLETDRLHDRLPSVISRIKLSSTYGTEQAVATRVNDHLQHRYLLSRSVVENLLFRNLRGFINDISKQLGRSFDHTEFELEVCYVWPHMIAIKEPPPLEQDYISRRDLVEFFTTRWVGRAVDAVGISGSGKTSLASEVAALSPRSESERSVFYAEVRADARLRDVLVGIAFHLRRFGIDGPFGIAVTPDLADEDVVARLARLYSTIQRETLILVDLADGRCNQAFARELATFVRGLSSAGCRLVIFGQESALRELSQLEKDQIGVRHLDIRGFSFEEFVTLASRYHTSPDGALLYDVYQRATAGRGAGLFARLAQSLARATSLQQMSEMVARPAEDMLAFAEKQRFSQVSPAARSAAEKLVCFALPFTRQDAEEIFPEDNVGVAIHEMRALGLLRSHEADSFEMHETVRAGLEDAIALGVRRAAHEALALWYRGRGSVTEEILHLDKAARHQEACERARAAFLRGKRWAALAAYVREHKLVSVEDVIRTIAEPESVEDQYLLSGILRGLQEPVPVDQLVCIMRTQSDRCHADYTWGLAVIRAILEFEPRRLFDLVMWEMETTTDQDRLKSALGRIMVAARQKRGLLEPASIELFDRQQPERKRLLLPFVLLDWRRDVLKPAFEFIARDQDAGENSGPLSFWHRLALRWDTLADTVEFLAALPTVNPAVMLSARSVLFGPFADPIWGQRAKLQAHCNEILMNFSVYPESVLLGAMRVLVYIGDSQVWAQCQPLLARDDSVGTFAKFVPAFVPHLCDPTHYEHLALDHSARPTDRLMALAVLAWVGVNLGRLYTCMMTSEDDARERWDFHFLMLCARAPFAEAIPIAERYMATADHNGLTLFVPVLMKLGELAAPGATDLLLRALNHSDPRLRQCAALVLARRRAKLALVPLIERYKAEQEPKLPPLLAAAIIASGPGSAGDIPSDVHADPSTRLWRCVLSTRLRDRSGADDLVAIACDATQSWQLRRSAIFAAGRLPFEMALSRILQPIMALRSPLTLDQSFSLCCHAVLAAVLLECSRDMLPYFIRGRAAFVAVHADLFETCMKQWMSAHDIPHGSDAAAWLFDRLTHHGWPAAIDAPDRVIDELHFPILQSAALRSLRLSGRPDLIEAQIPSAYHSWFAMKCLLECARVGKRGAEVFSRLSQKLDASQFNTDQRLRHFLTEIRDSGTPKAVTEPSSPAEQQPSPAVRLSYDAATRILSGLDPDFRSATPVALEAIQADELERLIRLADPANDDHRGIEKYIPLVSFTTGGYTVARRQTTMTGESAATLIRPAIAAANRFGLEIRWHQELMRGVVADTYVPRFLACLGELNERDRFYEELSENGDALLLYVCRAPRSTSLLSFIDRRIVPFLTRYLFSGTDEIFEGLCALALRVSGPEIDAVLAGLLHRWTQRFDIKSPLLQHQGNHKLWQGFNQLAGHTRFRAIEGWQSSLSAVSQATLSPWNRQTIVRVLERDPHSYVQIECMLFRTENWEHFHQDEIDRLDNAAERLFPQLLEE